MSEGASDGPPLARFEAGQGWGEGMAEGQRRLVGFHSLTPTLSPVLGVRG